MKKLILSFVALLSIIGVNAQQYKIGYVDTEYILNSMPEYKEAQKELDKLSADWQQQVERKYTEIEKMYKNYQAEEILLTEEMKKKREDEIIQKERDAKEFQKSKFGVDGELFKKRKELIQPIQDKVYEAIADVAKAGSYYIIFDKASQNGLTILYAKSSINVSDDVLKKMGFTPGESK